MDKVSFTTKSGREVLVNKEKSNIQAARAAGWKETIRMNAQKNAEQATDGDKKQ